MKSKKFTRIASVVLAGVIILSGAFNSQQNVKATRDDGKGDADTALAKLYYNAMYQCIKEGSKSVINQQTIDAQKVVIGDIFDGISESKNVGSIVEHHVTNEKGEVDDYNDWKNGAVRCSDDKSKLATSGLKVFQQLAQKNGQSISLRDIVCDYKGSGAGIMDPAAGTYLIYRDIKNDGTGCGTLFDKQDGGNFSYKGGANEYFRTVIVNKVFGGESKIPGGKLSEYTELEKYYLEKVLFTTACASSSEVEKAAAVYTVKMYDESKGEWREYYYSNAVSSDTTAKFSPYTDGASLVKKKCTELKDDLNNWAEDDEIRKGNADVIAQNGSTTIDVKHIDDVEDQCKQNSVTGIAWLLCPIISLVKNAMEWLYEEAVDPFLQVDSKIFDTENKLYETWNYFRGFANILLIILLLVIIVSQLTGFGIDNYGIKKSLPKLITAVLLINLSYIICQGAVDLSNLFGYGFFRMFNDMISIPQGAVDNAGTGASVAAGTAILGTVTVAAGLISGGAVFASLGSALIAALPAMLMGLLSGLISILFFFLILGARQGGIIILIAVSPIALASYILPNTKKLFDKWFDLFKKLLLVYPICGLMMGGCALASSVILGSVGGEDASAVKNFIYGLVGLIVGVCPFFFIPTILKNSMAAMGDIGNKVSNLGKRLGGRAGGYAGNKLEKSKAFENALGRSHEKTNDKLDKIKEAQLNKKAQKAFGKDYNQLDKDQRKSLLEDSLTAETLAKQREGFAKQKTDRQKGLAGAAFASDSDVVAGQTKQAWAQAQEDANSSKLWGNQGFKIGDKTYVQDEDGNLVNTENQDDVINAKDVGLKIGENINAEELGRRMKTAFGEDGMEQRFGSKDPKISASTYDEMWQKKQAMERSNQLGQLSEFAGQDKSTLSRAAIVAGATASSDHINGVLDQDTEYISTITKDGKTYARGKDNKYHHGDEVLSSDEVEEARKNNNIVNATRRHGDNSFRDAEGRAIDAGAVADARINDGIRTRAQIDKMQSSMSRTGEVFGKSAFAGENSSYLESASAQEAYTSQINKLKDTKKWNESTISAVDVGGQQYVFNQKSGSYINSSTGVEATGRTLDEVNKALADNKVTKYTKNESGQYIDSLGNTLRNGSTLEAQGFSQSQGSLKIAEADKGRTSTTGAITGAFAGVAASEISNAARLSAENAGIEQTNQVLGDADAITVNRNAGRNTATTRTAAAQTSEVRLEQTMSTNAGAESIQNEVNTQLAASGNVSGPSAEQRIGRTEAQIQDAVNRGSTILKNQFQDTIAVNEVGEAEITPEVAKARAESRYIAQSTRNYQDQYSGYSRTEIEAEYRKAVDGYEENKLDNRARLSAATKAAIDNGLEKQALDYATKHDIPLDDHALELFTDSGSSLLSNYAKEQGKKSEADRVQLSAFLRDDANGFGKMVREKGQAFVSSLNDDSLAIINDNHGVIPAEYIINELSKNPNGKIQAQLMTNLENNIDHNNPSLSATLTQLNGMSKSVSVKVFNLLSKDEKDKLKTEFNDPNNSTIAAKVNDQLRAAIQAHII